MQTQETNNIIEDFVRDWLTPTSTERSEISEKYIEVSDMLKGDKFQNGSYARFTAIKPVNDLDIIWELPQTIVTGRQIVEKVIDPNELDISNVLSDLANELKQEYARIGKQVIIKSQSHSVGIYFGKTEDDFSIDIVPGIPLDEKNSFGEVLYYVPEIIGYSKQRRKKIYEQDKAISWIKSDPKGYILDARTLNDKNNSFRKTVKVVKSWKRVIKKSNTNFPLKSFHLELIINDIFKKNMTCDSQAAMGDFIDNLLSYIREPIFSDKADPNKYIDEYLREISDTEMALVREEIRKFKIIFDKIQAEESKDEIHRLLKNLCISHGNVNGSIYIVPPVIVKNEARKPWCISN